MGWPWEGACPGWEGLLSREFNLTQVLGGADPGSPPDLQSHPLFIVLFCGEGGEDKGYSE